MKPKPMLYIGYDVPKAQKFALRLQTLGAVAGVRSYVPPADTRCHEVDDDIAEKIWKSRAVIIFLSEARSTNTKAVDDEIEHARNAGTALTIISVAKLDDTPGDFVRSTMAMILVGLGIANLSNEGLQV
jgi:hypothetical protein